MREEKGKVGKRRRTIAREEVGEREWEEEREGDMLQGLSHVSRLKPPNQKCWLHP